MAKTMHSVLNALKDISEERHNPTGEKLNLGLKLAAATPLKATAKVVAFSALRSSKNCATMSAKKERCAMGVDLTTTVKICLDQDFLKRGTVSAKAILREIVNDPDVYDFLTSASLSCKWVVDTDKIPFEENRVVHIVEATTTARRPVEELLKHKDTLTGGGILVDIKQSDDYGWNYRKVEVNGKTIFEEHWSVHERSVYRHNKPSEDFNKSTEDFIIDEFMPDVRIKMTLNQGLA